MDENVTTTISIAGGPADPIDLNDPEKAQKVLKQAMADKSDDRQREAFSPDKTGQTVKAGHLRAFVERVERLEEDKQSIADDIKEVFAEMKGNGFNTKAVRQIIRLRKKDQPELQEEEAILKIYMNALRMT